VLPEPQPDRIVLPDAEAVLTSPAPASQAEPSLFTPYIEPDFEPTPYDYRPGDRRSGFEPPTTFEDDPLFGPAPPDPAAQDAPALELVAAPELVPDAGPTAASPEATSSWDAVARFQIRSYTFRSSASSTRSSWLGVRRKSVGRMASWASCAFFTRV
jgi:hypothetical protein